MEDQTYYNRLLNSQKLESVYETKIKRIHQYLQAEIDFAQSMLSGAEVVLELGAGYGRIVKEIAPFANTVIGVDFSKASVEYGQYYLKAFKNTSLIEMNAFDMRYDAEFDVVFCLQNGLSAIKGDQNELIRKTLEVTKKNGKVVFTTYSEKFWQTRLEWFEEQSEKELLGKINYETTKNGIIECFDGFKSISFSQDELSNFAKKTGYPYEVVEMDESFLALTIRKI